MHIISGNYFHQHNDGDGDKTCGDGVGMETISWGWDGEGDVTSSPCHSLEVTTVIVMPRCTDCVQTSRGRVTSGRARRHFCAVQRSRITNSANIFISRRLPQLQRLQSSMTAPKTFAPDASPSRTWCAICRYSRQDGPRTSSSVRPNEFCKFIKFNFRLLICWRFSNCCCLFRNDFSFLLDVVATTNILS